MNKEKLRMQMLAGVITESEYKSNITGEPKVFLIEKGISKEIAMSDIGGISNLIYDMGGAEISHYDEYNVVVVDSMDVNDFIENINNEKKVYIQYNLNNIYKFPQANKIIISKLVYHLSNPINFANTVNSSLKSNGNIEFFSEIMDKNDKKFIKTLIEQYGFYLPYNVKPNQLGSLKDKTFILSRTEQPKPPLRTYKFKIENDLGENGTISYSEQENGGWLEQIISGNIPKEISMRGTKPLVWNDGMVNDLPNSLSKKPYGNGISPLNPKYNQFQPEISKHRNWTKWEKID